MLFHTSLPSLIGGVSEQAINVRDKSASNEQVNVIPDFVKGVHKRPPSILLNEVTGVTTPKEMSTFVFTTRDKKKWMLLVTKTTAKVYSLDDGLEKAISGSSTAFLNYIEGFDTGMDLLCLQIGDTSFVANPNKLIEKTTTDRSWVRPKGTFGFAFVQNSAPDTEYTLDIDGHDCTVTTVSATDAAHSVKNATTKIAADLLTDLVTSGGYTYTELPLTDNRVKGGRWDVAGKYVKADTELRAYVLGSAIYFEKDTAAIPSPLTLIPKDGLGGAGIRAGVSRTQSIADLPQYFLNGFNITIDGNAATDIDDYYVQYDAIKDKWTETHGSSIADEGLVVSSMPTSVAYADGVFSFSTPEWVSQRRVGDEHSSPIPSFVGKKITDLFIYQNRLGMAAGTSLVTSQVGIFTDFWRDTTLVVLDTDPVDVNIQSRQPVNIETVQTINNQLVLFTDVGQWVSNHGGAFTPSTVSFEQMTAHLMDSRIRPVLYNDLVYFVRKNQNTGRLLRYRAGGDLQGTKADDVTAHCPTYIKSPLRKLAVVDTAQLVAVQTLRQPDTLYIYKFQESNGELVQSAWGKWEFEGVAILDIETIGTDIFLFIKYGDKYYIEVIDLSGERYRENPNETYTNEYFTNDSGSGLDGYSWVKLDHMQINQTAVVHPFTAATTTTPLPVFYVDTKYNESTNVVPVDDGDVKTIYYSGVRYNSLYEFGQLTVPVTSGGIQTVALGSRVMLQQLKLHYLNSGRFKVTVELTGRGSFSYEYTGNIVGVSTLSSSLAFKDGIFVIPLASEAQNVTVRVESDEYTPFEIHAAEFRFRTHLRGTRV